MTRPRCVLLARARGPRNARQIEIGSRMNTTKLTKVGSDRRPARLLGTGALVLVTALAGLATGCGPSRAQQQQAMMVAMQREQMAGMNATAAGAPGTGTMGGVAGVGTPVGAPGAVTPGVASASGTTSPVLVDEATYRLAPGDLLDVKFPYHPEENERVPVRPDGRISLQVVGDIPAAGHTIQELEETIVKKASVTLKSPVVSVVIAQLAEHKVFVGGSVSKPGFVLFQEGMTPLQAIFERGGFSDDAKTDSIVYLHRAGDQVETQKLDLQAVLDGDSSEQIALGPDDIIIVPRTFIGKADVWMDQYVRGLLPTIPRPGLDLTTFIP
jgi:polysaccharide export outer membrane protein